MGYSCNDGHSRCCFHVDPPESTFDKLIFFAMGSVIVGLIISTVGYVFPRGDTEPDPSLTARQQEAVDIANNDLANALDICIVVGMAFIGLGGVVTSVVFCKSVIFRECEVGDRDEDNYNLMEQPTYGTVERTQR